ncbi:MAG: aminopeptidase [Spirochaetes bacterium]|nr:aminopeptidase [Spirochaetota bacterium]
MQDIRLKKLAQVVVNYSAKIKKDDFVYLLCDSVCEPWMIEVLEAALVTGAHVEYAMGSSNLREIRLKKSTEEQLKYGDLVMETMMEKMDVWLTAWGDINLKNLANIPPEKNRFNSLGKSKWHDQFISRLNNGTLRWCGSQFPTYSNAQQAKMSLREYEDFVYNACLLNYDDPIEEWKKISQKQQRWVEYLNKKNLLEIVSPETHIKINMENRTWDNCDGRLNFPDGEICAAPVEDGVDGHITFSYPGIYMGKDIENIKLIVRNGRVVEASASSGEDLLHEILKTDAGASRFGEIAIGTNYNIKQFTRNMLFDEKIGGTIHMALGSPVSKESNNISVIHWDMLCDMNEDARIYADDELFYENGKFIDAVLDN